MLTSTDEIDALLQKYLLLLDEYTRARELLSKLQASVQLDLSRANFSAERGIRYGQDYYDERMQASRKVQVEGNEDSTTASVPRIAIVSTNTKDTSSDAAPKAEDATSESTVPADGSEDSAATKRSSPIPSQDTADVPTQPTEDNEDEKDEATPAATSQSIFNTKDPIRWFGIIAPMALRSAQRTSIELVTDVVPRVVELDKQLKELEISIRRARKYHAKEVKKSEVEEVNA